MLFSTRWRIWRRSVRFGGLSRLGVYLRATRTAASNVWYLPLLGIVFFALAVFATEEYLRSYDDFAATIRSVDLVQALLGIIIFVVSAWFLCFVLATVWGLVLSVRRTSIPAAIAKGSRETGLLSFVRLSNRHLRKFWELDRSDDDPFIVCRRACHWLTAWTRMLIGTLRAAHIMEGLDADKGFFNRLNHLLVVALADGLGAQLKPMHGEGDFFGDDVTDRYSQRTLVSDGHDMELRFIQAEPQRRFPTKQIDVGEVPKPKYVAFVCLVNAARDPIWILPLADVVTELKQLCDESKELLSEPLSFERVIAALKENQFPVFHRIKNELADADVLTLERGANDVVPLLLEEKRADGSIRYKSGYDPNKIDYTKVPGGARRALFLFQRALDRASQTKAVPIGLRSGDVLLVKNQEAFYARRELRDRWFRLPTLLPRVRWVRVYYTFPTGAETTHWRRRVRRPWSRVRDLEDQAAELATP